MTTAKEIYSINHNACTFVNCFTFEKASRIKEVIEFLKVGLVINCLPFFLPFVLGAATASGVKTIRVRGTYGNSEIIEKAREFGWRVEGRDEQDQTVLHLTNKQKRR